MSITGREENPRRFGFAAKVLVVPWKCEEFSSFFQIIVEMKSLHITGAADTSHRPNLCFSPE
jgi:hypothetical protein